MSYNFAFEIADIKGKSMVITESLENDFIQACTNFGRTTKLKLTILSYRAIKEAQYGWSHYQESLVEIMELKDKVKNLEAQLEEKEKEPEAVPERTRYYANVGPKVKNDYSIIIDMHKEGKNNNVIAKELGTTRQNIGRIIKMWKEGKINV